MDEQIEFSEGYKRWKEIRFICIVLLLVRGVAVQNIMDVVLRGVFCLSVQKIITLIFVGNVMSFHAKNAEIIRRGSISNHKFQFA